MPQTSPSTSPPMEMKSYAIQSFNHCGRHCLSRLVLANVVLMLEASSPQRSATTKNRLIVVHRVAGYLFVILFCIMAYSMSQRLAGSGLTGHVPTYLVVHVVLALSLVPLLLLKIVAARFYKQNYSSLMALGMTIFVVSCVLVSLPVSSQLLRSASPGNLAPKIVSGLLIAVCLAQCLQILRPARKPSRAVVEAVPTPEIPAPEISLQDHQSTKGWMTLLLAQIEQQTHDTRTLRFLIPRERRLCFKPGQFLTFNWTVNGQRVPRSYTISSSPAHTDYVEVTPKRMENGCVSVFLNDQAKPGLTVEANGPYGQFYFDETTHPSIVLLAAGSGITPMISMLRYIDDLRLSTVVTLLYCVRTRKDIIFETELERLGHSLANFNYKVCLSQPDEAWKGQGGHLAEEFISQHVTDLDSPTFFLCGPKGSAAAHPSSSGLTRCKRKGRVGGHLRRARGRHSAVPGGRGAKPGVDAGIIRSCFFLVRLIILCFSPNQREVGIPWKTPVDLNEINADLLERADDAASLIGISGHHLIVRQSLYPGKRGRSASPNPYKVSGSPFQTPSRL